MWNQNNNAPPIPFRPGANVGNQHMAAPMPSGFGVPPGPPGGFNFGRPAPG